MTKGDIVRVLDNPTWGYGPIGAVEEIVDDRMRVALDDPSDPVFPYEWFGANELATLDLAAWEKAKKNVA